MIKTVNGEIYNINIDDIADDISNSSYISELEKFASVFFEEKNHECDLLSVHGIMDSPIYISLADVNNHMIDGDNHVLFSSNMFIEARLNPHLAAGGIVPALNCHGEPVCLLKRYFNNAYFHDYSGITEAPDTRVFDLYEAIVMIDVTESAYILLKDVLGGYKGRIICIGPDWQGFSDIVPNRDNVEFIYDKRNLPEEVVNKKTMYLMNFFSKAGGTGERCKEGLFSYDEIMGLVYMFSIKRPQGQKNPFKRFLLIDPMFFINGLMTICNICSYIYAYAMANGFIPVLRLAHSKNNIYPDYENEDIWSKFFNQPYGDEALEWQESMNVYQFPEAYITHSVVWLMEQIVQCEKVDLVNTFYINDDVKNEVDIVREKVLPVPEKTIGVLIRGTDYTSTHLPGHTIMATPEQVMEKVEEMLSQKEYDYIFLSTEDSDVLEKMKHLCGDKLSYIDQRRFSIEPNTLLSEQKRERKNEGWMRGKEYLVPMQLLSECGAFIASGNCGGTSCVINTNGNQFKESYVFELGTY